jgi:hypothetical protein
MHFHEFNFLIRQRCRLEQDAVRNAHLADIMQQGATVNMHQFVFAHADCPGQVQGHFGHTLRVTLCFLIAQIQRARPAFDGGIVRGGQFLVAGLQILDQRGDVNCNGSLGCQRFQKIHHVQAQLDRRFLVHFQHAGHLILGYQWDGVINHKSLGNAQSIAG